MYIYICIYIYRCRMSNSTSTVCKAWLIPHCNNFIEFHAWRSVHIYIRWQQFIGSKNYLVSFAKEPYKNRTGFQKRPSCLRSLRMYSHAHTHTHTYTHTQVHIHTLSKPCTSRQASSAPIHITIHWKRSKQWSPNSGGFPLVISLTISDLLCICPLLI